jgi:hypothetical protein
VRDYIWQQSTNILSQGRDPSGDKSTQPRSVIILPTRRLIVRDLRGLPINGNPLNNGFSGC